MDPTAPNADHDESDERAILGRNAFRLEGDYWTVVFEHRTVMRDLQDLAAAQADKHPQTGSGRTAGLSQALGDSGEILDARAKDAYRRRLVEIDQDIEQAQASGDIERAEQPAAERDFLIRELSRAVGLSGRGRRAGSASERARAGVTRALRMAMARIGDHHPLLGAHLDRTIRTGTYCSLTSPTLAPPPGGISGDRGEDTGFWMSGLNEL